MTTPIDRAALEKALEGWMPEHERLCILTAAARAHLETIPRTKMVEVWRVEWAVSLSAKSTEVFAQHYWTGAGADDAAKVVREGGAVCVKVTGPHQQEVPA